MPSDPPPLDYRRSRPPRSSAGAAQRNWLVAATAVAVGLALNPVLWMYAISLMRPNVRIEAEHGAALFVVSAVMHLAAGVALFKFKAAAPPTESSRDSADLPILLAAGAIGLSLLTSGCGGFGWLFLRDRIGG